MGSVGGEPYTFERTGAPYIACEPSSFCPLTSAPSNLKLNFTKARKIAPKRNPKPPPPYLPRYASAPRMQSAGTSPAGAALKS